MNDLSDDRSSSRGPRRRPRQQPFVLTVLMAILAGLVAACGGSGPAASARPAGPATYQQVLAYVQCIRAHGYPTEPNPVQGPGGIITPPQGPPAPAPAPPALQAARHACQQLQPPYQPSIPAVRAKILAALEKFSQCMRGHAIANFPDPISSPHMIGFSTTGLATASPQFLAAQQACDKIVPGTDPGGQQ
jgi:hypothetical protein